jgi:hypothetical protein
MLTPAISGENREGAGNSIRRFSRRDLVLVNEPVGCIYSVATPDVLILQEDRVCAPHALDDT